jgi:hypothetical protein
VPDLAVTTVDFSCRLPIVTMTTDAGVVTMQGGYITLPESRLTTDPSGTMRSRSPQEDVATTATPVLYGSGGFPFFDRAKSRWVPVAPRQSLADGSAYAYIATNLQTSATKAYVVDVASGSVRTFDLPDTSELWQVADYGPAGVYIMEMSALGGPGGGVWLLNPATGAVRLVRQVSQVWMVRDGYAWVARFNPEDTPPPSHSELAPANSLVRIDLASGAETVWFYRAGTYPWMLGMDSQRRPIINVQDGVRLIDQPGSAGELIDPRSGLLGEPHGDGDRIWFGSQHGIYLYRSHRGFQRVFAHQSDPSNPSLVEPAGFCL